MKLVDFNRWWPRQKVLERGGGTKHFHHPVVGEVTIDYEALTLPADPDQTLFIYTARPGASQDAMRLLASWSLDAPRSAGHPRTEAAGRSATSAAAAPDDTSQETP